MTIRTLSDTEKDDVFIESPSAAEFDMDEWKEEQRPFTQTGKLIEGAIRCYFYDELQKMKGDADEIALRNVYFDADEGVRLSFERIWY